MAKNIYLAVNASGVKKAFAELDKEARKATTELNSVNKALKLDPQSVELMTAKQTALSNSIEVTEKQLQLLQSVQEKIKKAYSEGKIDNGQYISFLNDVAKAKSKLEDLKQQSDNTTPSIAKVGTQSEKTAIEQKDLGNQTEKAKNNLKDEGTIAKDTASKIDILKISANTAKTALSTMGNVGKTTISAMGTVAKTVSETIATMSAVAVASLGAIATKSADVGKDFDSSVSQLAATMGKTTDEITELTAKAKELGSTTSFTAKESAQGLNILAQAGLNSADQISAIDSVLNLASAGSLDLASSASYVTGAVKGFKDEMSNADYYANLIAKGATLANTNVQGLGEALSRSSATSKSYSQSAESVTLALLKLAEQNISGEEASTSLNRAMADLYTPTANAKAVLDDLGMSMYNSDGSAKDFNVAISELNDKLSNMTDEQANTLKNTIFTTNGLNAFNKMVSTSSEKSQEFATALSTASDGIGSASKQAKTMLDNLQGDITIFESATQGFGLTIYENLRDPLRNMVQTATQYMGELDSAFQLDGTKGAIQKAGEIFGEISVQATMQAPKMIDSAVSFMQSFGNAFVKNSHILVYSAKTIVSTVVSEIVKNAPSVFTGATKIINEIVNGLVDLSPTVTDGALEIIKNLCNSLTSNTSRFMNSASKIILQIADGLIQATPIMADSGIKIISEIGKSVVKNAPKLASAGLKIVSGLVNSVTGVMPRELGEPIKKSFDTIRKSIESGGLKKALSTAITLFKEIVKIGANLTAKVLPIFADTIDFLGEHINLILPTLVGFYSAFKTYEIVGTITALIGGFIRAVELEAGAVNLATIAQKLWNTEMNLNPLGIVIGTVTSLIGFLGALSLAHKDTSEDIDLLAEQGNKIGDSFNNAFKSMDDFKNSVSSAKGILDDFDPSIIISDDKKEKLDTEVEETQKRINTLCEKASDERKGLTQKEIDELDNLFKKQRELADKEVKIKTDYQNVVYDMSETLAKNNDLTTAEYEVEAKKYLKSAQDTRDSVIQYAQEQKINVLAEKRGLIGTDKQYTQEWYDAQTKYAEEEYKKTIANANKLYADTSSVIANGYKDRATALRMYQDGQTKANKEFEDEEIKHNAVVKDLEDTFNQNVAELRRKYGNDTSQFNAEYEILETEYHKNLEYENEDHRKKLEQTNKDLSMSMSNEATEQLGVWLGMLTDTEMYGGKIANSDKEFVNSALDQISRLPKESKDLMKDTIQGMVDGLDENEHLLYDKAGNIVGSFIGIIKSTLGIHSPSRVMRSLFGFVGKGALLGLQDTKKDIIKEADNIANNVIPKLDNSRLSIPINTGNIPSVSALSKQGVTNNNTNDNSITVNVKIGTIQGNFDDNDINKIAEAVKNEISYDLNRRMRAY